MVQKNISSTVLMSDKKEIVVLVGGGTKGHLFPAIAVGETIENKFNKTALIITDIFDAKSTTSLKTIIIPRMSLKVTRVQKMLLPLKMIVTLFKLLYAYARCRPKLIVGFGGFTTFVPLLAGIILRIPIILHEQNSVLGKVNEILAKYAYKISLGFFDALTPPTRYSHKCVFNKNPVRNQIAFTKTQANLSEQQFVLLVIGGSQGARAFNTIIPNAIKQLTKLNPKARLKIFQQASKDQHQYLKNFYKQLLIESSIEEFFFNMSEKYNNAHLVICRSGASTIEELVALTKPSILIPLPSSAKDHQNLNAKYLETLGCAFRVEQDEHCEQNLCDLLLNMLQNTEVLSNMSHKLLDLKNRNNSNLEDEIIKALGVKTD
jgi:UDP-N-acetylglucosamine--N-acetylmuramyl-(pentapeptide) pyrophosphoryl-undecaprenol N-acetylglucosamine transferase